MYGMGGMYGGGMGGGMYGMGSGMYGMGSGMYGSGLGGGMYGSGLGGGMYGNSYGSHNTFGSNTLNTGYGNTLHNNPSDPNHGLQGGSSAVTALGGQPGSNGLLPPAPGTQQQPGSPINTIEAPPPLNETNEERARRVQAERRKQRQIIKQQREQMRQIRMKAKLEVAGHLTNVFVQTLRSAMELFAVCFGTYYSMKAVRSFANMQENTGGMMGGGGYMRSVNGRLIPTSAGAMPPGGYTAQKAPATAAQASSSAAASSVGSRLSRWRSWILFVAVFVVGEVVYGFVARAREMAQRRQRARLRMQDEFGTVLSNREVESLLNSEDEDGLASGAEEEWMNSPYTAEGKEDGARRQQQRIMEGAFRDAARTTRGSRRVYVAMYDYNPPVSPMSAVASPSNQSGGVGGAQRPDFASFKAGDEFVVEWYAKDSWCEAVTMCSGAPDATGSGGQRVLVPGNFLRPLESITKL